MLRLFAVSLAAIAVAVSADAAPAPQESWGKAGISLDQYRQDALDCGLQGHYMDISKTQDAQEFVRASRQLDAMTTGSNSPNVTSAGSTGPAGNDSVEQLASYAADQQHVVESLRPEERFRDIKKVLESTTEKCLVQRGYSKFRLTDDQRRQLRHLKFGSDERRFYLYSLAKNPAVLQSQRVSAEPQ